MRYLKALGVGLLSAVAAPALYFAVKEAWAFLYVALASRREPKQRAMA